MVKIFQLLTSNITDSDAKFINNLLTQLSENTYQYSCQDIKLFLEQPNFFACTCLDGQADKITGLAVLKIDDIRMFTQNYKEGYIGDVVVDENYHRQGRAEGLMSYLISLAKTFNLIHINLTSNPNNPKRAPAIKLYEKLGFKLVGQINGSNYYRLKL